MTRPPPFIKQSDDDSDGDGACDECLGENCGLCVDIEEDRLKTECTKCCVGYVVVCSFNVLFIHSLVAGLCIGLIAGAMARDPARLSVVETIIGRAHGRIAQDILLAAGIVGVIFLIVYVPIRCFGLKSAKCQVALDLSFLLLLICLTAAAGFLGIAASDDSDNLREKLKDYVMIDYTGDTSDYSDALWDRTQIGYRCCGASSAKDYINSTWSYLNSTRNVPLSCCRRSSDGTVLSEALCQSTAHGVQIGAITDTTTPTFLYTKSCSEELGQAFQVYIAQIIGLSYCMIFLEACGICFAVYIFFLRKRRTVNPADRYKVTEDVEDNRLFKRRENGKLPYMPDRSVKTVSSQIANGRPAAGHEGPASSGTSEPVPGTSTGGETPSKSSPAGPPRTTEAEKKIIDMFAAQRPGYMDKPKAAKPTTSQTTRSDQEIIDMFKVRNPDENTAGQGQSVFDPRSKSDDTDRNIFDEKMNIFTASEEKMKLPNRIGSNGSLSRENHDISTEDGDPITQGQTEVKAAYGTIDIEGTKEQETVT